MRLSQSPENKECDWKASVLPGDILRFRFPVAENSAPDDTEGPKLRPCLVLEIIHLSGQRFVKLAYGTSAATTANKGCELRINHPDGCAAAGLNRPTRFVGARSIIVSLNHQGFEPYPNTGSPHRGRLNGTLMCRLAVVRRRLTLAATSASKPTTQRKALKREGEARGFPDWNHTLRLSTSNQKETK